MSIPFARPKVLLIAGATLLSLATAPLAASAAPYAFASNQITGLTVTFVGGGALPVSGTPTTSIIDSANFTGFAGSTFSSPNVVVGQANDITMATSGTGAFGGENTFTPVGPGAFNGTRSDASIGAGNASSGGVSVNNVAEAYSTTVGGQSQSGNQANIQFTIQGTGQALRVAGTDLVRLIATAGLGESATATIANSLTLQGGGATFSATLPSGMNQTIGTGSVGPTATPFDITTSVLTAGTLYVLTLGSQAIVSISPAVRVPEPATLALLGAGLLGLAAVRRRAA